MAIVILKKTDKGHDALRVRDPSLPLRLRPAFILFDGKKNIEQVMALLPKQQGNLQILADIKMLVEHGLLELQQGGPAEQAVYLSEGTDTDQDAETGFGGLTAPAPRAPQKSASQRASTPAQASSLNDRYMQSYALASRLTSELGLKGFGLQLRIEKAQSDKDLVALLPRMRTLIDDAKMQPLERILLRPDSAPSNASMISPTGLTPSTRGAAAHA